MERTDVAQKLNAKSAYDDDATGLVKVLLRGDAFNVKGISTLADHDGRRLTDLEFDYLGNSSCGLFRVHVPGGKYGYLDVNGNFAIQPLYDYAQDFSEDLAWVTRGGKLYILERAGGETEPESLPRGEYAVVEPFSEGLARVSILNMGGFWGFMSLAYHHDEASNAGIWGYVNKAGTVVVAPQYIFAEDFDGGLAIVCKGEWTKGKKWDNEYNTGRYWSEEMKWGAIDRNGLEVIPCKFEEIKWRPWSNGSFEGCNIIKKYLAAMDENGKWGIIDFKGNWVVVPQFDDVGYECDTSPNGDMFVFYGRKIWGGGNPDDTPCGVYSISKQKVLIPAEKYRYIEFVSDFEISVSENSQWNSSVNIRIPE